MITVEGGFAKVVNVVSEVNGENVRTLIYVKMTYADEQAKSILSKELRKYGFTYESGNNDDSRYRIVITKVWEVIE